MAAKTGNTKTNEYGVSPHEKLRGAVVVQAVGVRVPSLTF